jgi:UDP-GlcNAc:undecaprenyl-phosphate GlcNAc-1-phosphate transferase
MIYFSTLFLSLFLTIALTPLSRKLCLRIHAVDFPGGRKIHACPIPKGGGIAMALGSLVPVILWTIPDTFVRATLLGAGVMLLCGLVDDLRPLDYKSKFAAQLLGALIVVLYGGVEIRKLGLLLPDGVSLPHAVAIPFTILVIVGATNAVNLSDGLDGLAGGICLLSFSCIGYLAYRNEQVTIAILSVAVAGAIFGFLRFNTFPATLFMGDAGSQFLGFMVICLALGLTQGNTALSPLLPLVILGFPILDTLAVMVGRISNGESPFHADNKHFHHRLLTLGLFHTEAVSVIYLVQAGLVASAFFLRFQSEWLLLTGYVAFATLVTGLFHVADQTGFQLKRHDFITAVKGKLKVWKEKAPLIRFSYRTIEFGLPVLLVFSCLVPKQPPGYLSYIALGLVPVMLLSFVINNGWAGRATRLALYFIIPTVAYFSEADKAGWVGGLALYVYNLSFGIAALFSFLTLKFTRRRKGFRVSPMDFIILFVGVIMIVLPDPRIQDHHVGFVAVKMIILLFGYEVLMGELREKVKEVSATTIAALILFGLKGLI